MLIDNSFSSMSPKADDFGLAHGSWFDGGDVFQQRWFLQAASLKQSYFENKVEDNGRLLGLFRYALSPSRLSITWDGMMHWGHVVTPVLDPELSSAEAVRVLDKLISRLPKDARLRFTCLPDSTTRQIYVDAFIAAGFTHATQTTYSFPSDDPGITTRLDKKHRTHFNAARKSLDVISLGAKDFVDFYKFNLVAARKKPYAPLKVAERIIETGLRLPEPRVKIFAARRPEAPAGLLDAAVACIWDSRRCYLWLMSRRPGASDAEQKPHPDAMKILIVEVAEHARKLGLIFDLDGVTTGGSEHFYKSVLKAPCVEYRDVFSRETRLHVAFDILANHYRSYRRIILYFLREKSFIAASPHRRLYRSIDILLRAV